MTNRTPRCQFCRRSDGVLVAGEPQQMGLRCRTSYRMVTPRWHQSCLDAEVAFNAASRARADAERLAGFVAAMRDHCYTEEQIAAVTQRGAA